MTQHIYIKAQRDRGLRVGQLFVVSELPVSGTDNWESVNRSHPNDPSGPDSQADYMELVGEQVRIVDIEPTTVWVQKRDEKGGRYWDVPHFVLEKRDIKLQIGPSESAKASVIYKNNSIRVGCCRIPHEDLREICQNVFPDGI